MTQEEEKFLSECPAWAMKKGIDSLRMWRFVKQIMPLDWDHREDWMHSRILDDDREFLLTTAKIVAVRETLRFWDNMQNETA